LLLLVVGRYRPQGNRVNDSCGGDEACEEVVVPCGGFAFEAESIVLDSV
jgi:hypothetical protein